MKLPDKFQIKVNNQEESAKVQQKLLDLGYLFATYHNNPRNEIKEFAGGREHYLVISQTIEWNEVLYKPEEYKKISLSSFLGDESPKTPVAYLYTEYSEEVWALAAKWIENTEYTVGGEGEIKGDKSIVLNLLNKLLWKTKIDKDTVKNEAEILEPLEFLAKIRDLPEKKKKIEINILPWPVTIEGESVRIGCQTATLSAFQEIVRLIESDREANFNGYTLSPRRKMLYVYGEKSLPWEVWEKFVEESKKNNLLWTSKI
jgi:hypothetical protein